jgi:hypothetical protein
MGKLARIVTGVFETQHSHVCAKGCHGSRIRKGEIIKVTIGLAEPMSEGDMTRCLLTSQRSGRIYNVTQRV